MNSRQRLAAYLAGEPVDRRPNLTNVGSAVARYANDGAGMGVDVYCRDWQKMAEAARVAESLSQTENLACEVHAESAGRVRLRVTAAEEHIDLVCEAEAALRDMAAETGDIAMQLDRAEIDPEAARTLLNLSASRLEDALTRLRNVPGAQDSPVTARLLALTEQFRASLFVLSGENTENTLSLSAKIKYNNIDITLEHLRYLRELNAL